MEPSVKKITATSKPLVDEKAEGKRQSDYKRLSMRSQQQLSSLQEKMLHPEEKGNVDTNTIPIRAELLSEVEGLISALDWYFLH